MTLVYVVIAFACGFIVSTLIEAKRQQKREDNWRYWNEKMNEDIERFDGSPVYNDKERG